MEFRELNLQSELQKCIAEAGYLICTPVQEQVLTNAFGGHDLYVQSQTGTGKTAAFLIVIFQRLLTEPLLNGKKALIMSPTRELAVQIEEEAKKLSKYLPFKTGSFYGGVGYEQQRAVLRDKAQILIGTPGRVLDLNESGAMNLMDTAFLVIDEADRMFDMGFYPDLRKLIKVVPPSDKRQTMLFSATLNSWVKNLAWEYTKSPFEIEIAPETVTLDAVDQLLYHVPSENKMKLLLGILEREKPESAIIFCNTKRYTEIIARRLNVNGYKCEYIIGDLPQSKRLKIIEQVKNGTTRFLAATDVAARGLDIEGLSMVVNYDMPTEAENYVHRIGRTGKAFTFASEQDVYELAGIERYIEKAIPWENAGEHLFAEDKSAGHGGSDRGRKQESRPPKRNSKKTPPPPRNEEKKEKKREKKSKNSSRSPHKKESELSKMTFEERMAYYREKYSAKDANSHEKRTEKPAQNRKSRAKTVSHRPEPATAAPKPSLKKEEKKDFPPIKETEKKNETKEAKNIFVKFLDIFKKK